MRKQAFQPGEIRDEQNNIIRPGAYGKNSAFATAANDGILDYIINNFDALYDTLTGGMLYVDSLPESGDASKLYVIKSNGECYRYDGAKFVLMDGAAVDFISNAKLAEDGTMTLTTAAGRSLSVTLDPVNAIADKAQKSADAAKASETAVNETAVTINAKAEEAEANADAASTSASAAKASASAAKASAGEAASSQSAAAGSKSAAASSASSSASSALAAKTSETNAKASETKAAGSESAAASSASAAASSASAAASSQSAAKASEANAKTSETNAAASASASAAAASSASTSAENASTSASNAANSEAAAKTAQAAAEKARDDANSVVTKLTGVMKYAGQVNNYSDLSDVTKNTGDVWNIVNADTANGIKAGDNVAWNGSNWDNLSGTVDLSIYAEKADYQKTITSATANGATITFSHKDGTTSTVTVNNVASATAATNDAKGQKIDTTYEKIADASNVHTSLQNSINGLSTGKQDKLTFDNVPTANSSNPVTSGGIKTVLDTKLDKTGTAVSASKLKTARTISLTGNVSGSATFDGSTNINISTTVNESKHAAAADTATKATQDASGNVISDTYATKSSLSSYQTKLTFDSTPTANSSNPVTSAGIKAAIDAKTVDLSNYYTKTQVDSAISTAISAITDGDNNSY